MMCAMVSVFVTRTQGISLQNAESQGKFLPDVECQGECHSDYAYKGTSLPNNECQGIPLLDA